jgi:hypothetical protein
VGTPLYLLGAALYLLGAALYLLGAALYLLGKTAVQVGRALAPLVPAFRRLGTQCVPNELDTQALPLIGGSDRWSRIGLFLETPTDDRRVRYTIDFDGILRQLGEKRN